MRTNRESEHLGVERLVNLRICTLLNAYHSLVAENPDAGRCRAFFVYKFRCNPPHLLGLQVVSCANLPKIDAFSKTDPYVQISLHDGQVLHTSTLALTPRPEPASVTAKPVLCRQNYN